jgi:hypothetical protein
MVQINTEKKTTMFCFRYINFMIPFNYICTVNYFTSMWRFYYSGNNNISIDRKSRWGVPEVQIDFKGGEREVLADHSNSALREVVWESGVREFARSNPLPSHAQPPPTSGLVLYASFNFNLLSPLPPPSRHPLVMNPGYFSTAFIKPAGPIEPLLILY